VGSVVIGGYAVKNFKISSELHPVNENLGSLSHADILDIKRKREKRGHNMWYHVDLGINAY
jgi:hypothetical protein